MLATAGVGRSNTDLCVCGMLVQDMASRQWVGPGPMLAERPQTGRKVLAVAAQAVRQAGMWARAWRRMVD